MAKTRPRKIAPDRDKATGRRLRQAREQRGLKQKEIADHLGVVHSAVSHWESGRRLPKFGTVVRIADLTGTDATELLGLKPPSTPHPNAGFASFADLAIAKHYQSTNAGNLLEPFTNPKPAPTQPCDRWETLKAIGMIALATAAVVVLLAVGRFVHWPTPQTVIVHMETSQPDAPNRPAP